MSKEYQGITRNRKPAKGQKKPYERNALYSAAIEFKRRHPLATALEAWRHFAGLAGISTMVLAYDHAADSLTYAPDSRRYGSREIKRRSFEQGYYRLPE